MAKKTIKLSENTFNKLIEAAIVEATAAGAACAPGEPGQNADGAGQFIQPLTKPMRRKIYDPQPETDKD